MPASGGSVCRQARSTELENAVQGFLATELRETKRKAKNDLISERMKHLSAENNFWG